MADKRKLQGTPYVFIVRQCFASLCVTVITTSATCWFIFFVGNRRRSCAFLGIPIPEL